MSIKNIPYYEFIRFNEYLSFTQSHFSYII
nr:MAG TPA: hypothetical protein [Caudoviricetes sp.]